MPSPLISFRLPESVVGPLRTAAKEKGITVADVIRHLCARVAADPRELKGLPSEPYVYMTPSTTNRGHGRRRAEQ